MQTTEILPIIAFHGQDGIKAVSAKALYVHLYGSDAETYSRWAKKNIEESPYAVRGEDWVVSDIRVENPQGGRPSQDYDLRLDFAKKLSLMAKSSAGDRIRDYFIAVETRARLVQLQQEWNLPKTFSEALRALAYSHEEKEALEMKIAIDAPLVAYAEKVQSSPTSFTVDVSAKELKLPVMAFREFVQGKCLFRRGRSWLPYEDYTKRGWFEVKTSTYNHNGTEHTYHTPMITGFGRVKLQEAWDKAHQMESKAA